MVCNILWGFMLLGIWDKMVEISGDILKKDFKDKVFKKVDIE